MSAEDLAPRPPGTRHSALITCLGVLFLIPRIALLFARQPFYDELFTRWIGAKSFGGILAALRYDSGPPLYYFLVHLLGNPSIDVLRVVSLLFSCGTVALLLASKRLGNARFWAVALLALYPPAFMLSAYARAYPLCALLVAAGVLALDADRPFAAAAAFLGAAYSHYYGVLFFPLLLLKGRRGFVATALAGVAFLPGFWLAAHQPVEATAWNIWSPWSMLDLSFSGGYPSLIPFPSPAIAAAVGLPLMALGVARSWRFAPYVLVPLALTLVFALAGRRIYFPLRFEIVIAAPLTLWIAASLERWSRHVRIALATLLMTLGAGVAGQAFLNNLHLPADACVDGALFVRDHVPPGTPVVASAYCYLFAESTLGPRVQAFPAEQGLHPGWWRPIRPEEEAAAVRRLPRGEFVWLGQVAPEMQVILRHRRIESAVELDGHTRLLRVAPDTLH